MARDRVAAGTGAVSEASGTPGMVDTGLCRLDTSVIMVSREAGAWSNSHLTIASCVLTKILAIGSSDKLM